MTPFKEGRLACEKGYVCISSYDSNVNIETLLEWQKGYQESKRLRADSILQKLYNEGAVGFYQKGNVIIARSGEGFSIYLSKENIIELISFLDRWIGELPE